MFNRPGFHTSEFLVSLLAVIGSALTALQGSLSPRLAAWFSIAAVVSYAISRGLAKTETRTTTTPPSPPPVA